MNQSIFIGLKTIDLTGKQFGRLQVKGFAGKQKDRQAVWSCICDCGKEVVVAGGHLRTGHSQSCGCRSSQLSTERFTKHGKTNTSTHSVWANMLTRCYNKSNHAFKNYGGRGIFVCERWHEFAAFLEDMGEKPDGLSIDRMNNDAGYMPGNCRWATSKEQSCNRRNNVILTVHGVSKFLSAWAKDLGMTHSGITSRIKAGWSIESACTKPPRRGSSSGHHLRAMRAAK